MQAVPDDPADLLSAASVDAAVRALAELNRHHLESMDDDERAGAAAHWRELAVAVLTAAAAGADAASAGDDGPGRAVLVFEDAGGDDVAIQVSFHPELEELGGGEVAATPAQAAALELLQELAGDDEPA